MARVARMPDARPWARPLSQVLELEPAGADRFTTRLDGFGAVTLGCATLAAAQTTERSLHGLHAWFLRPPPTDRPVEVVVERVRDGRRFSQRRVSVQSGEQRICELLASFAAPSAGFEAQDVRLEATTPAPAALPTEEEIARPAWIRRSGSTATLPGTTGCISLRRA